MRKFPFFVVFFCGFIVNDLMGQSVAQKLQKAFKQFEADEQLKHATSSLYVIDAGTGKVIFDKNSQVGLAPASTQKIITSVTAFELLGKDFRYQTDFSYYNRDTEGPTIIISSYGDPTFGSWRYGQTRPENILTGLSHAIVDKKIPFRQLPVYIWKLTSDEQAIPDGWIWQDIGNYYGAGAAGFNWRENQTDVTLTSGSTIGDRVTVKAYNSLFHRPERANLFDNKLKSAARGTGDNAYYYFGYGNYFSQLPLFRGTIPVNEKEFKISIAVADAENIFLQELNKYFESSNELRTKDSLLQATPGWQTTTEANTFYTHYSPTLDSIIYWFNKKSINLYGEALIKTLGFKKASIGTTDTGVAVLRRFWKEKGLDEDELNMYDGSGLSPLNRVTTHAQVEILKYAKSKNWFPYFYDALPEYNAIKMKSGTINDVKGFCGYHVSKDGKEYIFSFLVNNYSGRASDLVNKMYIVLNNLK